MSDEISEFHLQIDRYVKGKLSPSELDHFEDYLMEHPEIIPDIEAARLIKDTVQPGGDEETAPAPRAWIQQPLSMAASILLIITGSLHFVGGDTESIEGAVVAEIQLSKMRNAATPTFALPESGAVLLTVDAGPSHAARYAVQVLDWNGIEAISAATAEANQGWIQLVTTPLAPGQYTLKAHPIDRSDIEGIELTFSISRD